MKCADVLIIGSLNLAGGVRWAVTFLALPRRQVATAAVSKGIWVCSELSTEFNPFAAGVVADPSPAHP